MAAVNEAAEFDDICLDPMPEMSSSEERQQYKSSVISLENPFRRKLLKLFIRIASIIGGFFENKLKISGARHRFIRFLSRIPGWIRFPISGVLCEELSINDVPVRIYIPRLKKQNEKFGVIVYCHGGAFVYSSARAYHLTTAYLCKDTQAVVISVDYRLAPEHPFPAGLDDCSNVTRAILDGIVSIPHIRLDRDHVIVVGDGCGGNFAVAIALDLIRFPSRHFLHGVVSICPPLQAVTTRLLPSYTIFPTNDALKLNFRANRFLHLYAGELNANAAVRDAISNDRHLPTDDYKRLMKVCLHCCLSNVLIISWSSTDYRSSFEH